MNRKRLILILAVLLVVAAAVAASLYLTFKPPAATTSEYIVQEGDTCKKIAHDNHTTVESLIELNALTSDCRIMVGQKLILVAPAP
jgi:LysM repeat protein